MKKLKTLAQAIKAIEVMDACDKCKTSSGDSTGYGLAGGWLSVYLHGYPCEEHLKLLFDA